MKKIFSIITVLAITAMIVPSSAQALTADELQVQINALLAQLSALQTQLGTLQGSTGNVTGCSITSFDRNLKQGMTGNDVKCLQVVLNSSADTQVAASGVGSSGSETTYFGGLTKAAVMKFQTKNAISPVAGYVGPITRAKLNSMLAGGVVPITPITPITPIAPAGGLTISLASDSPASATIPAGAFNQPFTKINLTAGSGGDISVSKITVTRTGLSANTDLDLVKIFEGTIQKGNGASLNSNNQAVFTFSTPIVITAGTTKALTVKADIYSSAGSGRSIVLSVVSASDVVSNASSTSGSAIGNPMTMTSVTIGSLTIAAGPNNPSSDLAPEVGNTAVRILQMNLLCGATEDVEVRQVIAVKVGTINNTDISKVELYNDTDIASLASVTTFDAEGRATFDLASPLLITKGNSKNLSVRVDIASGSGRSIYAKVKDAGAYTVTAIGKTFGYGVGFGTSSWTGIAESQTVAAGSLVVTKSASTPATGYVAPGGTAVPIVTFDLEAKGEGVTITEFNNTVTLATSGTHTTAESDITSCKLVDESGNTVAGPVDATDATGTDVADTNVDYIHFTDTFTAPLGVHKYTVKCNLASALTGGSIVIGFDNSNLAENSSGGNDPYDGITAKGATSNDTIYPTPTGSDVLGNTLTFQVAAMTVVTMTTPVAGDIVPGQQNVHFANIQLSAVSSGENLNVTSITVTDNVTGAAVQGNDIQNLRLFDASISQSACTGTGRAWDTTLKMCRLAPIMQPNETTVNTDDTTVFTLSTPLVISKAGSSTVKVYGDYKAGVGTTSESHAFYIAAVTDIVAIGTTTGTTLSTAMKGSTTTGTGQAMTYGTGGKGTLTTALDYSRPASANIGVGDYGTTGIVMTKIKLTAGIEDVDIDYVDLTRTSAGTIGTGADSDIANVYLYEGSTLLATGVFRASPVWRFDLSNYTVPAYSYKIWTVKVDFNGRLTGATSRHQNAFDLAATTDLVATGKASGSTIYASAAVITQPDMYIFRSIPTFEVIAPASTALNSSDNQEILRIKITADAGGDIEITNAASEGNFIRFTLSGSCDNDAISTTEDFVLKNITDGNTIDTVTTDVTNIVLGTNGSDGVQYMVKFSTLTNPLQISAGTSKIITLEADLGDFETGGNTIKATIGATGSDLSWSDIDTDAVTDANANFIWLPLNGTTFSKPAT